jgi:hypothetical protein
MIEWNLVKNQSVEKTIDDSTYDNTGLGAAGLMSPIEQRAE